MFPIYLELGFDHILDLNGYDHILFIIALCAVFSVKDWKKILILVTAFTVGHSITLALSALRLITLPADLIELLIPVTILITAIQNFWLKADSKESWNMHYLLALCFGFIHGMGFSTYFKSLLGREAEIVLPLFAFNIGVEAGQICIVIALMILNYILVSLLRVKQSHWNYAISSLAVILSGYMIVEKLL